MTHSAARFALLLTLVAATAAAQTSQAPAAKAPIPAKPTSAATHTAATSAKPATPKPLPRTAIVSFHVPPTLPHVRGILKPVFAFGFQDSLVGTGEEALPLKLYTVKYSGYLASDGTKFDSSDDHDQPQRDADGKVVMDPDNKPVMVHGGPVQFIVGAHRVIQGWDLGFQGMRVGGKRRLFIPWQLAYGESGKPPVIPAKADLIFDIELVAMSDLPQRAQPPQTRPGQPNRPLGQIFGRPGSPAAPGVSGAVSGPSATAAATPAAPTPAPPAPAAAPAPSAPSQPKP